MFNMSMIIDTTFKVDAELLEKDYKQFIEKCKMSRIAVEDSKMPAVVVDMDMLEKVDFNIYKKSIEVALQVDAKYRTESAYGFVELCKKVVQFVGEHIIPEQSNSKVYSYMLPLYYDDLFVQGIVLVKKYGITSVYEYRPSYRNEHYKVTQQKDGAVVITYTRELK